jgi:hypothetical protein
MSSREIADLVESRHDDVKRSIQRSAAKGIISQPPMADGIRSANGVVERVYQIGERDSYVFVAQLSPEFAARLVDRWQELEEQTRNPVAAMSRLDLLIRAIERLAERGTVLFPPMVGVMGCRFRKRVPQYARAMLATVKGDPPGRNTGGSSQGFIGCVHWTLLLPPERADDTAGAAPLTARLRLPYALRSPSRSSSARSVRPKEPREAGGGCSDRCADLGRGA